MKNTFSGCSKVGAQTVSMPSYHEADCYVEKGWYRDLGAIKSSTYQFTMQSYLAGLELKQRLPSSMFCNSNCSNSGVIGSPQVIWDQRRAVAAWRGHCTGRGYGRKAFTKQPRVAVMQMSRQHPDLLDARLFFSRRCEGLQDKLNFGDKAVEYLQDTMTQRFKYQVDIDGDGCSGRLSKLLASGSVILKHFQRGQQHYVQQLRPYVHYVPVKQNLEDLLEKIRWLQANDNKAQAIAQNAKRFALDSLSPLAIDCYWLQLLLKYASLQDFVPGKTDEDSLVLPSQPGILEISVFPRRLSSGGNKPTEKQWFRTRCPASQ